MCLGPADNQGCMGLASCVVAHRVVSAFVGDEYGPEYVSVDIDDRVECVANDLEDVDWAFIRRARGVSGWVPRSFLEVEEAS